MSAQISPLHRLTMAAAHLSRAAPQEWGPFLEAVKAYAEDKKDQTISSPLPDLPVAQGRAQACAHILRILRDCQVEADRIDNKKKS